MNCDKCKLCETSFAGIGGKYKLNCIQGIGNKDSKIMIVDLHPRKIECETGIPFTGDGGMKLKECMAKANMPEEGVYFTYLVKCKTPVVERAKGKAKDRDPKMSELKTCVEYLKKEIEEIKPNIVVLLGGVVTKFVINKTGVGLIQGTPFWSEEYNTTFVPLNSPRFLLRPYASPEDETKFVDSLRYINQASVNNGFEEKKKLETNYIFCDNINKVNSVIKRLNTLDEFVKDIETTGLNPDTSDLLGISFSWKEGTGCYIPFNKWHKYFTEEELDEVDGRYLKRIHITESNNQKGKKNVTTIVGTMIYELEPYWSEDELESFLPSLKGAVASNQIRKIGHNIAFDVTYLNVKWNLDIQKANYCTMLADYLIDPERSGDRKLESMAWRLTDMGGYDDGLKGERKVGFINTPIEDLAHYGCGDSDCTYRIYQQQKAQMQDYIELLETIVVPLAIAVREIEYNGVRVDLEQVKKLEKEYSERIEKFEKSLFNLKDVKEYVKMHEDKDYEKHRLRVKSSKILSVKYKGKQLEAYILPKINRFNFGSTLHLRGLLDYIGIDTGKKTKTGLVSTDEKTLSALKGKHNVIDNLLELRHLKKIHSTYLKPIPDLAKFDGRLHTSYRLDKTATGRLASSKPNLQNIPKKRDGNLIRDYFIASEGCVLVECDLKQIEYRILAHFVNDRQMIKDIEDGLDIHRLIASEIYGIPEEQVTPEQRNKSKAVTFGVPYGRSSISLASEYGMSLEEAEDFRKALLNRYPKVQEWLNMAIKRAKVTGYVKTLFGRIRYLPKLHDSKFNIQEAEERKVVATVIQGTANDVLSIYTINIREKLKQIKSKTKIVLNVHDALFFDIPKEELKEVIKLVQTEMERPIANIRVPIRTDTQIGTRWGSLVAYESDKQY